MIEERYCSYEVARLLKKKGFDEECHRIYVGMTLEWTNTIYGEDAMSDNEIPDVDIDVITAPTHQMAMDWLRLVHKISIEISRSIDLNGNYHFSYTILDKECKYVRKGYTAFDWTYEDAVEAALKYCLIELI